MARSPEELRRVDEALLAVGVDPLAKPSWAGRSDAGAGGTAMIDGGAVIGPASRDEGFSGELRRQWRDPIRQEGRRAAKRAIQDQRSVPDDEYVGRDHQAHDHDWQ